MNSVHASQTIKNEFGKSINKGPQSILLFRRCLVNLVVEGSSPSLSGIVWLDIWICLSATRNERDGSIVARIPIRFSIVADVEVQAEQISALIDTQVSFTKCYEPCYNGHTVGSDMMKL
jgi:hypothetical protein